mmetsp:Transcript_49445/g.128992  ORF Transcript_49445/g.128992 Transcript_49445/m.128992 type:complete len:294 (+) Transcript_49445:307-1188(+)
MHPPEPRPVLHVNRRKQTQSCSFNATLPDPQPNRVGGPHALLAHPPPARPFVGRERMHLRIAPIHRGAFDAALPLGHERLERRPNTRVRRGLPRARPQRRGRGGEWAGLLLGLGLLGRRRRAEDLDRCLGRSRELVARRLQRSDALANGVLTVRSHHRSRRRLCVLGYLHIRTERAFASAKTSAVASTSLMIAEGRPVQTSPTRFDIREAAARAERAALPEASFASVRASPDLMRSRVFLAVAGAVATRTLQEEHRTINFFTEVLQSIASPERMGTSNMKNRRVRVTVAAVES